MDEQIDTATPSSTTAAAVERKLTGPAIVCLIIAGFALLASFSQPSSLIGVALFGGYAYYLYQGGRDFTGQMADGERRARAWLVWGGIAGLALVTGFTWAPALLVAAAAGAYAAYLFSGGRDVTREGPGGSRRSAAWMYYAGITALAVVLGFSHPAALVIALATGAYATYLYRGGRLVVWFW